MFTHQSIQLVDVQHAQQLAVAHHWEVRLVVEEPPDDEADDEDGDE